MSSRMIQRQVVQSVLGVAILLFSACGGDESAPSQLPPAGEPAIEMIQIRVGELLFDARVAGPLEGEPVLLLHGFPQSSYAFRKQLTALARAGYRAVAPDQRGYSPGARPEGAENYALGLIVQDAIGMADALGFGTFHLVGHDWGGAAAWVTATQFPNRVRSLTVFSTPHFAALGTELSNPESEQAQRSAYFNVFGAEGAEARFLAEDCSYLRSLFQGGAGEGRITAEDVQQYVDLLGTPEAMRAALNWYRALISNGSGGSSRNSPAPPPVQVPTLYVWSDQDSAFAPEAALATEQFVQGPYQFEILKGIGHWIPEEAADQVNALLLDHLARVVAVK